MPENKKWIIENPIDPSCVPDACGIGALYFEKLKQHGNKIAQVDSETGETQTHEEILLKSVCVAQEMTARGITADDVISLCTYNHMNTILPFLASTYLLNKISSLDPSLSLDDMKYMLNITKPRMIFCAPESVEAVELALKQNNLISDIVVFGETEKHIPFKEFLVIKGTENNFKPKCVENIYETAFIFFSSGTTGLPKGTCLTHYGLLYCCNYYRRCMSLAVSLYFSSPYWISYFFLNTISLLEGGRRIIYKKYDERNILGIIEKFKVTNTFLPPTFAYSITSNSDCYKFDTSSVQTILTGSSTIREAQILELQKVFPNSAIIQAYGLTEICGICALFNKNTEMNLLSTKRSSCGKLMPGFSCKIVDPETKEILGPYQPGEILLKSKCAMNGYYNRPNESKDCFDEEGYLHTGDILYYDEDKCLYFVDRIKDMFKYRTWHIIPNELERVILTHPAVKEVIVFGFPHDEDGDRSMAAVVLHDGANVTEYDIIKFFNEKVPDRKRLHAGVKFIKSIPKTTTGKYNRSALRQMVINKQI